MDNIIHNVEIRMSGTIKTKLHDVKRALILEEAAKLFESAGYEELKVSDLAKTAGVSVGTIYGFFESKEGLYMAYVKAQIGHYLDALEARFAQTESAEERLKEVFMLKFAVFVSKRRAVEECAKNNPLFFSNIRHAEPAMLEQVYVKIAAIVREINPTLDADGALRLSYVLSSLSDGYLSYWLAHAGDLLSQTETLHTQMLTLIKGC
jgi:AcrR family transcriptional regulator